MEIKRLKTGIWPHSGSGTSLLTEPTHSVGWRSRAPLDVLPHQHPSAPAPQLVVVTEDKPSIGAVPDLSTSTISFRRISPAHHKASFSLCLGRVGWGFRGSARSCWCSSAAVPPAEVLSVVYHWVLTGVYVKPLIMWKAKQSWI